MHYLLYYILTACLKKGVIMAKQKYYVVWAGRKTGIFSSWEACQSQVNGFKGARFKSFPSKAEAEAAFKADSETQKTKSSRPLPNKKIDNQQTQYIQDSIRSEERRVGKECRSWNMTHY